MTTALIVVYILGWVGFAALFRASYRGAPTDPDPAVMGLIIGLFWPVTVTFSLLLTLVDWVGQRLSRRL